MSIQRRPRHVTRDDVARWAGVSPSVVSYVVNDGPRNVAAATRLRVLAAIDALDYRPNGNARALRLSSSDAVGLILPNISNPFFAELAEELERYAYAQGKVLLVGNSNEDPTREARYIQNFLERQVDGLLLATVLGNASLSSIHATRTPIVLIDRPLNTATDIPIVAIDNAKAAACVTAHLLSHGHRKVACIGGPQDQIVAEQRIRGWKSALAEAGIDSSDSLLINTNFSVESGYQAAKVFLRDPEITAVFASSDSQMRGLLAALRREGRRVPQDVAVAGFDGTRDVGFSDPELTVAAQPLDQIARAAIATLLDEELQDTPIAPIPFELVIGQSCGCNVPEQ